MTESLRQLNASNRAIELTETNIVAAIKMMKTLPPAYADQPVVLAGLLQSLASIYVAEMTSSGYK